MYYLGGGSTRDKLIFLLKEEYAKIGKRISSLVLGRVINKFYFHEKIIINVTVIQLVQKIRTKLMCLKKMEEILLL